MIERYILKTKVMQEASFEDKEKNNESSMDDQNEYDNDKDCDYVKYKGKKHPSEATK